MPQRHDIRTKDARKRAGAGARSHNAQTNQGRTARRALPTRSTARPSAYDAPDPKLVTRRRFLIGGAVGGVAAAAAVGGAVYVQTQRNSVTIDTLSVAEDAVFDTESCEQLALDETFEQVGEYTLPFGSLAYASDDDIICYLSPTDGPSPLVTVSALSITGGYAWQILGAAVGASEGFEILDARATALGAVWVEANIFAETWRVLCAGFAQDGTLSGAHVVDEGGPGQETPSIAASGGRAWWQTMPAIHAENVRTGECTIKTCTFSAGEPLTALTATGRAACPISATADGIIAAPRHPESRSYYRLVRFDAAGGVAEDITLPSGMQPCAVGWGACGFAFCFDGTYSYGGGIAKLGTYTCATAGAGGYANQPWFRYNSTPLVAPAWCGNTWFVVKGSRRVAAVNPTTRQLCDFGLVSGCTDWGDFLCSEGTRTHVVTISQINQTTTDGTNETHAILRIFRPY